MIYIVKRIDEDLDFGCEERSKNAPVMAVVTLVNSAGEELKIKAEDAMLYEKAINEGNKVYFDKDNKLEKALDEAQKKNCTTKTVDTVSFVNMMQVVKSGNPRDWNVALMKNEDGHTIIGCEECNMRIKPESNP